MTALRRLLVRKGRDVLTIDPDDTDLDAIKAMAGKDIGGLVVVENGAPVGLVSIGDLVKSLIDEQKTTIEQLELYIHS